MCIIAIKPEGVPMPSKKKLSNCFYNNDDGAGWMHYDRENKRVVIDKGYMTWRLFWEAVCKQNFTKKDIVVFHFRWATAGFTSAANTHPFPLSDDVSDLQALRIWCDQAVVHNGVFGSGEKGLSDTMVYVRDVFSDKAIRENLHSFAIQSLLEDFVVGSKLAFMVKDGSIIRFGTGWKKDKGMLYSNDDYSRKYKFAKGYCTSTTSSYANPQWFKGGVNSPCSTCCEQTCKDCEYFEYLQGNNSDYAPSCPLCREFDDIVSDYQGVFECMTCGCVYDRDCQVIATIGTRGTNHRYTTRHADDTLPCHTCKEKEDRHCVDCERWKSALGS